MANTNPEEKDKKMDVFLWFVIFDFSHKTRATSERLLDKTLYDGVMIPQ